MIRNILLGIGITLVVFSLTLIAIDEFDVRENTSNQDNKQRLIKKAKKIGMIFPGDKYDNGISLSTGVDLAKVFKKNNNQEIIKKAKKLGMLFPGDKYNNNISLDQKYKLATNKKQDAKSKGKIKLETEIDLADKANSPRSSFPVTIHIPSGISSREVADLLVEKKVIENKTAFIKLLAKLNAENKIMAGTYKFSSQISPIELLLTLTAE